MTSPWQHETRLLLQSMVSMHFENECKMRTVAYIYKRTYIAYVDSNEHKDIQRERERESNIHISTYLHKHGRSFLDSEIN